MRLLKIGMLVAVLGACAVPALSGCSSGDSKGDQTSNIGKISLNLAGTANSGARYRLRNATFTVTGPKAASLSSETNVDASAITQELPAGNYLITLKTGWTLEKQNPDMTFTNAKAVLTSANPEGFTIVDQGTTPVIYQFKAGDDVVQLGDGTLSVQISVNDGCDAGQTQCSGACVDLTKDPNNCGACGLPCMSGVCTMGACGTLCNAGQALCGGVCVDVTGDPNNCGACGLVCMSPDPTQPAKCVNGACQTGCSAPDINCGASGCVDPSKDQNNCGACGNVCPAGNPCVNGLCQMGACVAPNILCGTNCVNLQNDPLNCGLCGQLCSGTQACINGACNGGPSATFSATFLPGQAPGAFCPQWQAFQSQIAPSATSISLTSNTGTQVCGDPMIAQQLCTAIHTHANVTIPCLGHSWSVDQCDGGTEVTVDTPACTCFGPVSTAIRPCSIDPTGTFTSAVNAQICQPTVAPQQITVKCQ
jgi:hypothetical protein